MKYSREYILRRAFDVFMNRGYDSTSISVLQEELNMSRGAMYRYFRNKEELFLAVIDTYFFSLFEKLLKNANKDLTTSELIEFIHRRQRLVINAFTRAGVTHTAFLNYTALMMQGAKHYPKFLDRFYVINKKLLETWRGALQKSIEAGEIRQDIDIDIMCILFNSISIKESSDRYTDDSMFAVNIMHDMDRRKEVMDYLYSLISSKN
ncbi:AcrR family transcriptional regulator [Dysgonomonas hofstadii]|uniref:AcrR family transcriptional regulator n=1 Tax=Dysgonomonas hofstadii TaxID=637886 RepID=A0A840CZV3_9BACT|nr:TetR/AcrR family transcriptional regulator [Dysgonomonas hofstadii]MBB4037533.1 AcrR family transcriptional regulator [Dysgonomonas hofstadii]